MRRWIGVLVVVLILGLGGGLLTTAVQRVRHEAARTQCVHNLKALGLTLESHHDTFRAYPTATISLAELPPEKRLSWLIEVVPQYDQGRLVIDRKKAWDSRGTSCPRSATSTTSSARWRPRAATTRSSSVS
jgi:hypothetical protein